MKKLLLILFAAIALNASAAQSDTLRVLAIGNSFSVDAVENNLHEIAVADGSVLVIGNMYIGGCSLERHHRNMKADADAYSYRKVSADGKRTVREATSLSFALADETWDVVTLQQSSPLSGKLETYEPFLGELYAYVHEAAPSAKIMWHQTWAYSANATHKAFPDYDMSTQKMYEAIVSASRSVCERYGMEIIPSGTAVQNMRGTAFRDNVTRDGYHLNQTAGRYIAAMTWYESLTGRDVTDNSYQGTRLEPERAALARKAAHMAVASPYAVTDLGFRNPRFIYDLSTVQPFTLPDALTMQDGRKVSDAPMWENERRPELLEMFAREMYGHAPGRPDALHFKEISCKKDALGGLAVRREVNIYFSANEKQYLTLLIYTPARARKPSPLFLGMNSTGNHTVSDEDDITVPAFSRYGIFKDSPRGSAASCWPLEMLLKAGYGVATFCSYDVDPDFESFIKDVPSLYLKKGQITPPDDGWGTIAAWAWGLSRVMDYLETDSRVASDKVAVFGHSRLGKTALWAGACDERFAMVISNCSGCGGASLSRWPLAETVQSINRTFPYWFCQNFKKYGADTSSLPFDQHELIALIAPRPVYVAAASKDLWAEATGQFMSIKEAAPVYELYGWKDALPDSCPAPDVLMKKGRARFHVRSGEHDMTVYDWKAYVRFADKWLK